MPCWACVTSVEVEEPRAEDAKDAEVKPIAAKRRKKRRTAERPAVAKAMAGRLQIYADKTRTKIAAKNA